MKAPPTFQAPGASRGPAYRIRFETIPESFELMRKDWAPWILLVLVQFAVTIVPMVLFEVLIFTSFGGFPSKLAKNAPAFPVARLVTILPIAILVFVVFAAALGVTSALAQRFALLKLRGYQVTKAHLWSLDGQFWRVVGWSVLMPIVLNLVFALVIGVFVAIGAGLHVFQSKDPVPALAVLIPGYIVLLCAMVGFQALLLLAPLLIADRRLGIIESAKLSVRTLWPHILPATGLFFVASILSGIGALACYIGILFTASLIHVVTAAVYHDFFRPSAPVLIESESGYPRPGY